MYRFLSSSQSTLPQSSNRSTASKSAGKSFFWRIPRQKNSHPPKAEASDFSSLRPRRGVIARKISDAHQRIFNLLGALALIVGLTLPSFAGAAQVTLQWDANGPEPGGYHIYMRTENQSYDYSTPAWSGSATTCTIDQLVDNTYYFVCRAFQDNEVSGDSNEVEYKVVINQAPQADAGSNQAVSANNQATLDGTGSIDPDGTIAAYQWSQTTGTSVTLANAAGANATFNAPNVASTSTLGFKLTVSDAEGLTASDTCQVTVLPVAPIDSDNDGLTDADETDLHGTDPNNPDTDGDGTPDGQEIGNGTDPNVDDSVTIPDPSQQTDKIWIEAEDGYIYAPMEIADDPQASESGFAWVATGVKKVNTPIQKKACASYQFDVSVAGDYVIWGHVLAETSATDSFYISIDGGNEMTWHTRLTEDGNWVWDPVTARRRHNDLRDASNPMRYYLEAGTHNLVIYQREAGTKIDRILVTNDLTYTPTGADEYPAQKIWIEAENGDILPPMQTAADANASTNGFLWVPDGASNVNTPTQETAHVTYQFDVAAAGDYMVWGRVLAETNGTDSFFVSIDGGSEITWHTRLSEGGNWVWDPVSARQYDDVRDDSNPMLFHLETGAHTLTIFQRESGTKIDRLLITNDAVDLPQEPIAPSLQKIWLEAETGVLDAPMQTGVDINASEGSYILIPNSNRKNSDPSAVAGQAVFSFSVPAADDYVIWGRVISNNSSSDSFFVSVDGLDYLTWHTKQGGQETWCWDVASQRGAGDPRDTSNPVIYHLEAGTHMLTIKHREDGTKLDRILITNDMEFSPL